MKQPSKLVEQATKGKPFVIAKAGNPLAKVTALDTPAAPKRIGFLEDHIVVPDDFDQFGIEEVAVLFGTRK
jgi:antitoxin (DNA-binding transcriptional repressor) of toxin-antitoxin stability system